MARGDSKKICNTEVKKLMRIGLLCCGHEHKTCNMSKPTRMATGWQIKSHVNYLIITKPYDIVFAAKIPLQDNIKYQVCKLAYCNLTQHKKDKNKKKEIGDIEEENNPCWCSACLAAKSGIHNLTKVCLLEVPCCDNENQQSKELVSLMLQEELDQLEELLENDLDVGDKLDEEVEVKEVDKDAMDVVEDKQATDEIQNKEGNDEQLKEKTTDGK